MRRGKTKKPERMTEAPGTRRVVRPHRPALGGTP